MVKKTPMQHAIRPRPPMMPAAKMTAPPMMLRSVPRLPIVR
jgi:hypothetical protein